VAYVLGSFRKKNTFVTEYNQTIYLRDQIVRIILTQ